MVLPVACCLPDPLPVWAGQNLLTVQQKIVFDFSSSCRHDASSFSELLLMLAGQRERFESGFEGRSRLAKPTLQVWFRSVGARVFHPLYVEGGVDASWVEVADLVDER